MTTIETTMLVTPTRVLYFYGKNGTLRHPTKTYYKSTDVILEATLVKDFGDGVAVWKFPAYKDLEPEKFYHYCHNANGTISTGSECSSLEAALESAARNLVWREYTEKKRELYRIHNAALAELEAEYKGRT